MRAGSRLGAASTLALILALGGCAGDFSRQKPALIASEPADSRVWNYDEPDAASASGNSAAEPVESADTPVSDDLWQRVRDGFGLPSDRERDAVRQWVQFYAGRPEHLQNTAANARPFLWHVVEEVESRGMPLELALLPMVESGYDPTAYSYKHASGMWQFMPFTARRFGLSENWWYDGRRDVLRSTTAALDYLEWLHKRYDDWLLALAAYNAGEGRVDRALKASSQDNFWALDLPRETENYVPKLLALKRLLLEPQQFNVEWPGVPNDPVTKLVTLPGQVELSIAAEMMDMPTGELQRINPGVRRWATHPDGPHRLLVPSDRVAKLRTALEERSPDTLVTWHRHEIRPGEALGTIAANYGTRVAVLREVNDLDGDLIRAGRHLLVPVGGEPASPPPESGGGATPNRYTVVNGDNLWEIARRFDVDVAELRRWNGLSADAILQPGQELRLRDGAAGREYRVRSGDSLWSIARRFGVSVAELRAWNGMPANTVLRPGQTLTIRGGAGNDYYRVRAGDSLWSIASRFSVAIKDLKSWNDIGGSTIRPGQRLRIAAR